MKSVQILFLLVFSVILLSGCGGAEERKAAYMEKALQSMEAGDLDKARIELKNVLQIDPKYAEGFYQIGQVFEKQQEFRKSFANYNKAVELDPENAKYQFKIGQFYLVLANDIEKTEEISQSILEKDPENTDGLLLKAGIKAKQDKVSEALEIADKLFAREPDNVQVAVFLASLHNKNKDYLKAIDVLERTLQSNPESINILSTLAQTYYESGKHNKAEEVLKKKIQLKPDNFAAYVDLVRFYRLTDKNDEAKSVLLNAINNNPDDEQRLTTLLNHVKQTEGNAAAINATIDLIEDYPESGNLRITLAQLYAEENDLNAVKETLNAAIEKFPEDATGINARVALANTYLAEKDVDKAKKSLEEAIELSPNDANVNLVKARIAIVENDDEEAVLSLRKVVRDAPSNLNAYYMLASAHRALGETEQAKDVIARAYESNRNNADNLLALAKYHIANGDREQAEKIIDDYLALDKKNYDALSIKVKLLNDKKQYEDAKTVAEDMISQFPDKPNGYVYSAAVAAGLNDAAAAESALIEGYEKTGNNMSILEMLTNVQSALKKHDEAIQRLDEKITEESSSVLMAMKGKALLAAGRLEEGETSLLKAKEYEDAPAQVYLLLSRLYASQGEKEKLMALLEEGVKRYPSNVDLSVTLASLYERDSDYDAAIKLYEGLVDAGTGGSNAVVLNNLAALLSDHRSNEESFQRALELVGPLQEIDQPMLQDTVGWVYYRNNQFDKAIEALNRAVEKSPENPVFNYHLGMVLYDSGNHEAAKKHLDIAVNSEQDFTGKAQAREVLDKI